MLVRARMGVGKLLKISRRCRNPEIQAGKASRAGGREGLQQIQENQKPGSGSLKLQSGAMG